MPKLPHRYASLVYGAIQAAITTGIASAIATFSVMNFTATSIEVWGWAWAYSLAIMLPVVMVFAPLIQRLVRNITST